MNENTTNELLKYTKALVSLQIHALNISGQLNKPEVLLSRVGLSARDIAEILGKNPGAVTKALQRAGKGNG
jgi:DNA-binding MarR family transcriptional regulator